MDLHRTTTTRDRKGQVLRKRLPSARTRDMSTVREFAGPDPTSDKVKSSFSNKGRSKFFDPCEEASKASLHCLDRNNYDRELCADFFRAYRECKSRWMNDRREARRRGEL